MTVAGYAAQLRLASQNNCPSLVSPIQSSPNRLSVSDVVDWNTLLGGNVSRGHDPEPIPHDLPHSVYFLFRNVRHVANRISKMRDMSCFLHKCFVADNILEVFFPAMLYHS
jgi:hypothetical protein